MTTIELQERTCMELFKEAVDRTTDCSDQTRSRIYEILQESQTMEEVCEALKTLCH